MGKTCANYGQKSFENMGAQFQNCQFDVGSGEQDTNRQNDFHLGTQGPLITDQRSLIYYTKSIHIYNAYNHIPTHTSIHIQILLTMYSLPMPMINITTNTFMKMDNTAIRFLDGVYFREMAANQL